MTSGAKRALLESAGYEVRFRDSEWVECLLSSGEESWLGRGRDREAALEDALRAALPSRLARELLERELLRSTGATLPAPPEHGGIQAGPTGEPGPARAAGVEAPREEPEPAVRAAPPRVLPQRIPMPPPLVRRDAIVARLDPERSLEELDVLMDRITDSRDELGLCAPERQRLAMLAWICEARAHTDAFSDDTRIRDRVGAISRQLTEMGKTFWPGSVTALQLQMQPRDLPRHVLGGPASTWARAAELAERALRTLEYQDERRGFDAYGWSDAGRLSPGPPDPGAQLEGLALEVERLGGPLSSGAPARAAEARPEPATFRVWVRSLRWLRGSDADPDRWARIAGRLRWWVSQRDAGLAPAARELDASYLPDQPWSVELGAPGLLEQGAPAAEGGFRRLSDHVLENIRSAMSGKRMVFVSNRRDPDLQSRLKDVLPSATLDWRVAEPRRIEALGEAIQQGAYDVVLGAIGFQSQGTDHLLAKACRRAGVKYLRVNRGRPIACLRALARDLDGAA